MSIFTANIRIRRDTRANFASANPPLLLLLGEIAVETDTGRFKIGDGATLWNSLGYAAGGAGTGKATTATGANQNTAIGSGALDVTGDANRNTALGYRAGYNINGGCDNTLVGRQAGQSITGGAGNANGFDNTCVGSNAGQGITTGTSNTLIGSSAGQILTSSDSTMVGYIAGLNTTTGSQNVFVGSRSGRFNTTGTGNVGVGNDALRGVSTLLPFRGTASTAVGSSALLNAMPSVASDSNTAIGFQAALDVRTGAFNVAVGNQALVQNLIGDNNTALGEYSGDGCKQSNNVYVGTSAAYRNWFGAGNVIIGRNAGAGNISIDNQKDEFPNASPSTTTGTSPCNTSENTVVGFEAFRYPKDTSGQSAGATVTMTQTVGSAITVTQTGHGLSSGAPVAFRSTSLNPAAQNPPGTPIDANASLTLLPSPLLSGRTYYAIVDNANTYRLAQSPDEATGVGFTPVTQIVCTAATGAGTYNRWPVGTVTALGNTIVGYQAGSNNPMSGKYNCLFGWKAGDALTTGDNNIVIGKDQDADSPTASNQINVGGVYFHDRLLYTERSDPAAPAANQAVVYARDNGGKTQLCVRFNTGAIQVLATEP